MLNLSNKVRHLVRYCVFGNLVDEKHFNYLKLTPLKLSAALCWKSACRQFDSAPGHQYWKLTEMWAFLSLQF